MIKKLKTTILTCLLASLNCQAHLNVRSFQLSAEQGLGSSYVRSIVQDANGYIWMGATNGLIRYDGYNPELITPDKRENRKLMLDERVQTVDTWLDRFILLRLRGQKYSCYDTQTDCFVDYTGNNTYDQSYQNYHILSNGELWLTNAEGQGTIITYDGKNFHSRPILQGDKLPEESIPVLPKAYSHLLTAGRILLTDNRRNLIIASMDGELWHIDNSTHKLTHLTGIFSEELYRLNGFPRYSVVTDKDGIIWVSTYGNGLFAHNPITGETTHFMKHGTNQAPIQTNILLYIYEDKAGNIWVCQENMGVSCISKQGMDIRMLYLTDADNIDHSNSIHLLTKIGNQIWVGNRFNMLQLTDGLLQNAQIINGYKDDIVAVCQDQQGTTWFGTRQNGVYAGKLNLRHNENDPTSLSEGKISDILCDRQGRIWITIFEAGLDLAIPDGKGGYTFRHFFTGENGIISPRQMLVDYNGAIWLCSNEGLFTFYPDELIANEKSYKHLNTDTKDPKTDEIHCIYEDQTHCILAGTTGRGLAEFDNRNPQKPSFMRCYNVNDGLPNNNVQQIIMDKMGNVWVGTDLGLARYYKEEHSFISLMPANTLQGNMFIEHAACLLDDGQLAFGTHHGIIINPLTVKVRKPLFAPRITGIDINGTSIRDIDNGQTYQLLEEGRAITLNHNQNSLSFHFSDFEYAEGVSSKYVYRLKGYDKEWSPLLDYNFAVYRNLPPGTYIMEAKVQNSNGVWNEAAVSQTIIINPPLWATSWAYLIYIILATVLGISIYRQLKHVNALHNSIKVEQQLTEFKMQFFTNISHEFRTPLTIIRGASERIRSINKVPSEMKQPVYSMQKSSERLLRMINQLLEFSKMHENKLQLAVEETEVVSFLRDIFMTFKVMAETKQISYQFSTNARSINTFVDRNFLDKIAFNLISNAIKYTPRHHDIIVRVKEEDHHFCLIVEDTGIGIPKEKQKELFERFNQSAFSRDSIGIGLHLTNELVRVHHGTINYKENPKGGSIFSVLLPTDRDTYTEQEFKVNRSDLLDKEEESIERYVLKEYKEPAPNPMNDRTVLIVEDDNDVREFLQQEIQRYFICQCAFDGNEALSKIKKEKPDLIVSDVMMPIMSGIELTEKIRHDKDIADIPIILLTALSGEKNVLKGLKNGADAYIEKPFSIPVLIAKSRQLIEQREQLRRQYAKETDNENKVPRQEIIVNEQDKRFKEQLDFWLSNHYHQPDLNIDTFAESMGYGRTTFYKRVKKIMGQTPNEYLKAMRMNNAAEMLKDDRLTVSEISYKVGFEDPYYFSKSFKSFFGISPTQYRKGEKPKQ